jgi:tripartite-type tricarboxylate transporter receptor subunit TctC
MVPVRRSALALAAAMLVLAPSAQAQNYPDRPVRVIVPYAPGGPTDISGRVIAQKLSEQLGKQFFVENVPGVGGNTGTGRAAQAAPEDRKSVV